MHDANQQDLRLIYNLEARLLRQHALSAAGVESMGPVAVLEVACLSPGKTIDDARGATGPDEVYGFVMPADELRQLATQLLAVADQQQAS